MPTIAETRKHLFANNASASLAANVLPSDTQITLAAGRGARFPDPAVNQIFKLTLRDVGTGAYEIVNVVSRTDDLLVVERGQEGTSAQSFSAQSTVAAHQVTAGTLDWLQALLND